MMQQEAIEEQEAASSASLSGQELSHSLLLSAWRSWASGWQKHPRVSPEFSALEESNWEPQARSLPLAFSWPLSGTSGI